MEKKIIPIKNYIILFVLCIGVVLLCLYMNSWYQMSEEAKIPKGVMSGFMPEVKLEEMDNYLQENPNIILYVSSSTDESIKRYEKKFKDYIVKKNSLGNYVYLDTNELELDKLSNKIESKTDKKLGQTLNYTVVPNVYVFKEGKIKAALYNKEQSKSTKELIRFIEKQEGIE